MYWQSELFPLDISEDTCDCHDYSVSLLTDTIIPNYYLEYKNKKYRLDSYLYNQRTPSFWYDIFDNRDKKCSFILFYGEKKNRRYCYTVLDITERGLLASSYYEIQEVDNVTKKNHSFQNLKNDTIAIIQANDIDILASVFFSKDMKFPVLKANNYLLREGRWLNPTSNPEVDIIMKHFEFIR